MFDFLRLFQNKILISVIFSYLVSGLIKGFFNYLKNNKFDLSVFFKTGGMPSSHTASISALTTAIYFLEGISNLFIVCLIVSFVIISDAVGIRRAAGKQAKILNKIADEFTHFRKLRTRRLYELLGHTPKQVIVGILLGIIITKIVFIL